MTSMILKSPRPPKAPQPRRRPGTTAADPFAPMSPGDIQHTVDRYAGMYGAPLPDAQIQTRAQGLIDPIVAAITGNINQRATTASNAIGANSQALAKALGSVDYGAPYHQAEQGQASVDAALRQSLAGQGDTLAQDLRSRLGQIQDPAVAGAADTVAGRGAAIGNTELARGSASLGNLLAAAAASKSYGQKMPGIAGLSGLQDIAGVQRQAVDDIAAQTGNLEQQLPSIVQNFRSENANLRGNRAQAAAQIYEALTGQNITKATAHAGLIGDQAKLDYAYANSDAASADRNATLTERTRHDKALEHAKTAPKPPTVKERQAALDKLDLYYYGVDPKQQYDSSLHQFVAVPGTGIPGIDYTQAVAHLMDGFAMTRDQATALANTLYQPGMRGRPASAAQVSAATVGREADARAASRGDQRPVTRAKPRPTQVYGPHGAHYARP